MHMSDEKHSPDKSGKELALDALKYALNLAEGEEWNLGEASIPAGDPRAHRGLIAYRKMLAAIVALEAVPSSDTAPVEALRLGQALAVTPLIGNLLDQWESVPNDLKDHIREIQAGFEQAMDAVEDAMQNHQPAVLSATRESEGYPGIAHDLETLRTALTNLLVQYEGVYDCIDNDGKRYQSQGAADAEVAARAALDATDKKRSRYVVERP